MSGSRRRLTRTTGCQQYGCDCADWLAAYVPAARRLMRRPCDADYDV